MHQPIYYPGQSLTQTDAGGQFSFSVVDVHNQRFGPYTTWPRDAVQAGLVMSHLGAQVSFSGSLIENLNDLEANNVHGGMWNNWASNDADYDVTTIQDYLDRFPVAADDLIRVEPGSWAGADNGDPEFQKWRGSPDDSGWSPDRNSWAVLTAAKNRVFTADDLAPAVGMQNILDGTGSNTEQAWHYLLRAYFLFAAVKIRDCHGGPGRAMVLCSKRISISIYRQQ
jgi:hypothetical protein